MITINRAPVLTLWAAVVAERLGFDHDEALTLGKAVAGLSAQAKGRRLGIFEPSPDSLEQKRREHGPDEVMIDFMQRHVPVIVTPQGIRASTHGKAIALIASVTHTESAPLIRGTASVIDGDTIEIHGERIRLDTIDAPESSQLCLDAAGKRYRCGQKSAFALADMIGRSVVTCHPKGHDRYRRTIAVCFKGETNLNAWMVTQGWAVAFRKYGIDYVPQEDEARLARHGIWAGSFDMPWDWRERNR